MSITTYLCRKCGTVSTKDELRDGPKTKGFSIEASNRMRTCKNVKCNGRIFYTSETKQHTNKK